MTDVLAQKSDDARELALEMDEYALLARLHKICHWLARERTRNDVNALIRTTFQETEHDAELWIQKAEDFMAMGLVEDSVKARQTYLVRLNEIHNLCMANAVRDQIEVITKPTKLKTEEGRIVVVEAQHTRVKSQVFDVGAVQAALKAAREIAHVQGARPSESRRGGPSIGNMNVQINNQNYPGAQLTQELADDQLLQLAGFTEGKDVPVLPEPEDS